MIRILIPSPAAVVLTAAALVPTAAQAASFDCSKATEPDEIAICSNPDLSALDSEMGALWFTYSKLPMLIGASGARHDEAEAFLRRRGACGGDTACLHQLYVERIRMLRQGIEKNLPGTGG
ncbi:hypothetical protein [Chelativorans sp.]|uniref:lysozyme inhibitor LprI family protein n=1 Tax=Chelativorans sp. TaxID=2203393 RepID=UPI00281196AF|nr:hypothetical protein [Chelativorans sp.]